MRTLVRLVRWVGLLACLVLCAAWAGTASTYLRCSLRGYLVHVGHGCLACFDYDQGRPFGWWLETHEISGTRCDCPTIETGVFGVTVACTPTWVPLVMIATPTLLLWIPRLRRRPPRGHCQACGYDLTGNVSGRCPECGTPVEREGKPA
jgi:hypothetical protein